MKIICLNGWGGKLHAPLVAYLWAEQPDVLCLQEVVHSPDATQDWLTYRDGDHVLPQRANFFRDVARALPEHAATFCPAARGVLWDGARSVPSFWGLATFVRRALPVIGQAQGFVPKKVLASIGEAKLTAPGKNRFSKRQKRLTSISLFHRHEHQSVPAADGSRAIPAAQ